MVSDLNVTKNNTTLKANTPHKGGITWQPWVHPPVTPQGHLQKIPRDYSIQPSGNLSAILRTGGGESGGGLQLEIRMK